MPSPKNRHQSRRLLCGEFGVDETGLRREAHNLIQTDTRLDLLGNRLVLIAPKDSKNGDVKIARRAVERGERLVEEQETIGTFALSRKRIR
jgi:ABC-type molybdate transport system substrate-binding protein